MTEQALAPEVQALVMIPTYNEAENLRLLLDQVVNQPSAFGAIIVDDNSPDGTGRIADELAAQYPGRVFVVHRLKERGRGTAGIAGFRRGLELGAPYLLEMDADFSHDPNDLPRLLQACREGADVSAGSRYVRGGKQLERTLYREFVSVASNLVYRLILGTKVRDISGGFKCYRRAAMAALDWDRFFSYGYSIGMETVFRQERLGLHIVEVPITFADRRYGQSKFRFREGLLCLWVSLRLVRQLGRA
ncbi:MAG TPA: polyprenol monophosphomannose synthase [Chloroflexota bacterium]|nr:polyprenol monophosphomannose synthase [Chloroflexota bacterium]